jgi:hypothetical protein
MQEQNKIAFRKNRNKFPVDPRETTASFWQAQRAFARAIAPALEFGSALLTQDTRIREEFASFIEIP